MNAHQIISKIDAKEQGLKSYFTGEPCLRGHIDVRSVANGVCYQCRRDNQNKYRAEHIEEDRQKCREWYAKNKEHANKWKKEWIAANPETYKDRRKKYRSKPANRAKEMLAAAKWSAKEKELPFDLDHEWILNKLLIGICELTDLPFNLEPLENGRQNPYTASLDRICPELGYVKSNVRMILWALNAAFNSYGEGVYADIARVYLAKHPESTNLT